MRMIWVEMQKTGVERMRSRRACRWTLYGVLTPQEAETWKGHASHGKQAIVARGEGSIDRDSGRMGRVGKP